MSKVVLQSATTGALGSSITYYTPVGINSFTSGTPTSEAALSSPYRSTGVLSNLYANATSNSSASSVTVRLRKNSGDANQSVSIPSSTTGVFTDDTNIDTVASGDVFNYKVVAAASGTITLTSVQIIFNSDNSTVVKWIMRSSGGVATSAVDTRFTPIAGHLDTFATTEANSQIELNVAGTWKNLHVYIGSNTRTASTVFGNRKNGADGAMSVSVGSTSTGLFEDTSNSDSIALDDDLNYYRRISSGSGTLTVNQIGSEFLTTDDSFSIINSRANPNSQNFGSTNYFPLGGNMDYFTESFVDEQIKLSGVLTNLVVRVTGNTINTGTSTFKTRKSGGAANLSVSVAASTTGLFEDASNSDLYANDSDRAAIQIVTSGASGALLWSVTSVKHQPLAIKDAISSAGMRVPPLR